MSWSDLGTISPVIVAVLTAAAILLVDLAWPDRRRPAIFTALFGLGCQIDSQLVNQRGFGFFFSGGL